ncbi:MULTISPECIES: OmpA family protein [unclassified Nonomuraea]|uniref:OmpA family protein n=1 Tax=unclassified Nonomuraea TaxID=2593643 RepID=UPI0033D1BD6B
MPSATLSAATADGGTPAADAPPLATLYGDGHTDGLATARIDVIGLERSAPNAVTARFRISADQGEVRLEGFHAGQLAGDTPYDYIQAASGFYLLDDPRFSVYYPMKKDNAEVRARCLCSYSGPLAKATPGSPALMWATYQVPPETTSLAVGFDSAGLTAPLPISPAGTGRPLDGEPDAAAIAAAFPLTVPLATRSNATTTSVTESDQQVELALNTDVLFAFDKATLTARAKQTLQRVAERVRTEAEGPVRVVGHTDDVGDDTYNMDLSLRRAKAVQKALTGLVGPVPLQVEGKGETEPAVRATSDAARARNRRVEVTFQRLPKPAGAPRTPVPTPSVTATTTATTPATTTGPTATGLRELTGLKADLQELRRINDRTLIATVTFRHAGGGDKVSLERGAWDPDVDQQAGIYGYKLDFFWLALTDAAHTRYFPLTTPGRLDVPRHCVCSTTVLKSLGAGEQIRMFVLMTAPPADVTSVDVNLFGFTPMHDVPITQ